MKCLESNAAMTQPNNLCDHKWMPRGICECGMTANDLWRQQKYEHDLQQHLTLQTVKARNLVKDHLGESRYSNIPIVLSDDPNSPPRLIGEGWGWYTKGGTPIRYPSAYSKKGWSNMEYHHSTLRYSVGQAWLRLQLEDETLPTQHVKSLQ